MPEIREDPLDRRWVIIAAERGARPMYHRRPATPPSTENGCPFCPGNEAETLAEIARVDDPSGEGWRVRVVPNKFPALRVEEALERRGDGLYDVVSGVGAHEVIIESPEHDADFSELSVDDLTAVLLCWRDRIRDLYCDQRIRSVMIFKNCGREAGSSVPHVHSQLLGLPVVPQRLRRRLRSGRRYFAQKERCLVCDLLAQERSDRRRVVAEQEGYLVWAPYASRFAFEQWVAPVTHRARFTALDDEQATGLAQALRTAVGGMRRALGDPAYNLALYADPQPDCAEARQLDPAFHWHLSVIPRLQPVAGFENFSDHAINAVPPEDAAAHLRRATP